MKTPFEILEIEESGDDEAIKKAYLAKVRQYPPEQAPAEFQKIRTAYEAVRTERDRMAHRLFHHDVPDKDELRELIIGAAAPRMPSAKLITKLLGEQLANYRIPIE